MSGPKHLWSGDWEHESAAASDELAGRQDVAARPEPVPAAPSGRARPRRRPPAEPPVPGGRRRLGRRALPLGLAALLLLAAAAYGLSSLLDSDGPGASTIARGSSPLRTVPFVPPATVLPPTQTIPSVPPTQTIPVPTPQMTPSTPSVPPASTTTAPTTTAPIAPQPVIWLGMELQTVSPGAAVIDTVAAGSPGALAGLEPGDLILVINHHPIHGTGDIAPAIRGLRAGDVVQLQVIHGSGYRRVAIPLAAPPSVYP